MEMIPVSVSVCSTPVDSECDKVINNAKFDFTKTSPISLLLPLAEPQLPFYHRLIIEWPAYSACLSRVAMTRMD